MATAKRTPKVSRITRDRTVAYARKQNPSSDGARGDASAADDPASAPAENNPEDSLVTEDRPATPHPPEAFAASPAAPATAPAVAGDLPGASVEPGLEPTLPVEPGEPERARTTTVAMPPQASIGAPPGMPAGTAPIEAPVNIGSAEDPTQMPGPREIPGGNPDDPAAPPGHVPRGDSRSMRRRTDQHEFALIYRVQTYVISRFGVVGTRGQWRVVEYPTSAAAGHAYAKECSRFVSEGFSDYRA